MLTKTNPGTSHWLPRAVAAVFIFVFCFSGLGLSVGQAQSEPQGLGGSYCQYECIRVELYNGRIYAESLAAGYELTLMIDDPANGPGIDYTGKRYTEGNEILLFNQENYLKPGMIITVSYGSTTISTVISSVAITAVDYANDTINGTSEPGKTITIKGTAGYDTYHVLYQRQVTADSLGNWGVDLGTGAQTYDIVEGSYIFAEAYDPEGHYTQIFERKSIPLITLDLTFDKIEADHWPPSGPVVLTIDDPANGVGTDYTKTINHTQEYFKVDLLGAFDIASGQTIVLSDGAYKKTIIPNLSINPTADYLAVSGTANSGTLVSVEFHGRSLIKGKQATADALGNWSVNIREPYYDESDYSIGPDSEIVASQIDVNSNTWKVRRTIPYAQIAANTTSGQLTAWDWPVGTDLTITIDDPSNGTGIDFTGYATMGGLPQAPQSTFDFGEFLLKPGQRITATDGVTSKELTVANLAVTSIDTDLNLIGGTSAPGALVKLFIEFNNWGFVEWAQTGANASGNWSFTYDPLAPGTHGRVQVSDNEYDITMVDWAAGSPVISAVNPQNIVVGSQGILLTVNGSDFYEKSTVNWNGNPLTTTYVSPTQLTASVNNTDVTAIGSAEITVSDTLGRSSNAAQVNITTFADVVPSSGYYRYVEGLYAQGITGGCAVAPLRYCPLNPVTRAQMAVFILKAMYGSTHVPETPTGVFGDVPVDHWAGGWIEQLAEEGITSGCSAGRYCPNSPVTRAQMAVFLLKAKYGSDYVPPTPTGVFGDVPVTHWAAAWIEKLAAEGITTGCGAGKYCPLNPVTRAQMAVFIDKAFGFPLVP